MVSFQKKIVLIKTVMEINSLAGHFLKLQDFVLVFFFEPSPPHNSQRIDANTDATNNTTHTNTNKHITHFQHRYRPTSLQVARGLHSYAKTVFFLHYVNMFAKQGMSNSEPYVHRERPTGRVIIVIVAEKREKTRERREKETREEKRREEEKKRRGEQEKQRRRKTLRV